MKLFLIKVGKAWNVLRRDGIFAGTKRIGTAFFSLFQSVKKGDILFVTNGVGDSARYRTRYVAEELEQHGFKTAITVQDNPFLASYVKMFSVFVFHRVLYTPQTQKFIQRLKKEGKEIIFETDDLTYDPEFLPYMAGYEKMNRLEKELYKNGLSGEIVGDPYVKVATTTTTYLAQKLAQKDKQVFLVRNKVSEADRELADELMQAPRHYDEWIRIAYLSGTASHNKDFAVITKPLIEVLERHKNVRLVLMGPLDTESALTQYADRIERRTFVPWVEHFKMIREMDINLAPLEVGNPFCEAKSELKFFEAGLVGVPTIASATETFREAITDGVDSYIALSSDEWREKLERLIVDTPFRLAMGERARQTTLSKYTTKQGESTEYYNYLKSKIEK